jgi:hypothetical protein
MVSAKPVPWDSIWDQRDLGVGSIATEPRRLLNFGVDRRRCAMKLGLKGIASTVALAIALSVTPAASSLALTVTIGAPSSPQEKRAKQSNSQQVNRARKGSDGSYGGYALRDWYRMDIE